MSRIPGPAMATACCGFRNAVIVLSLCTACPAGAGPVELPPEAVEGSDHTVDSADTLASGDLELGMGVSGIADDLTARRRRVRFSEPDLRGTVREGSSDPLAGGRLEGGGRAIDVAVGTLSPRWSRGLVLGAAGDPWQRTALAPTGRGRGRSGEGVALRARAGPELVVGRFARTDLAAARIGARALRLGAVAGRRGAQSSVGIEGARGQGELAFDRGGTWRTEGVLEREAGPARITAALRAGHAGFRSLAEPGRAGPARAATVATETGAGPGTMRVLASAWRFHPGEGGGRLALECERRLSDGSEVTVGFEEQHGARRERQRDPGMRQGGWLEWSRLARPIGLAARHEVWSARGALRGAVREVTAIRAVSTGPWGCSVSVGHSVYRVRRGESLYLREAESDRVLLRALTGEGHRTRVDLAIPLARGVLRAALHLDVRERERRPPRWDLEWARRTRPSRPRPSGPAASAAPALSPPSAPATASAEDTPCALPPRR